MPSADLTNLLLGGILAVLILENAPAWIESVSANVRMWRKQWRRRRG